MDDQNVQDARDGQAHLSGQIAKAIEYCSREYELTWGEVVGILQLLSHYYSTVAFDQSLEALIDDEEDIS